MSLPPRGDKAATLRRPRAVQFAQCLLVLEVLGFTASVVPGVRAAPGFDPVLDGWLQGSAYVVAAALAALRPLLSSKDRLVWGLLAAALGCRAFAFVVFLAVVRTLDPIPYPSLADAGWLASAVLLTAALVVLIAFRFEHVSVSSLLDGAVGALAATAIGLALLSGTLRELSSAGTSPSAVLVNLAYPAADVMLLVLVLVLLTGVRWHASGALVLLLAGIAGFAITDTLFLAQQVAGSFRPGTYLSALTLLPTAFIAWAAWVRVEAPSETRRPWLPTLVVPTVFSLTCLSLLVYATQNPVPEPSVWLASAGALLIVARAGLSFRTVRVVAEARRDARTDELTGLANRRAFNEAMERTLRDRATDDPVALLILDLNGFKSLNDAFGHQRGDEILAMVGHRLRQALRPADLIARIGGDEFAIILEGASAESAAQVAERIQAVLGQPLPFPEPGLSVSATVGIAVCPSDGKDASELLQHADLAMYAAKAHRGGYARFRPEMHQGVRERVALVTRLESAIADGEMTVHYQPQVSLTSGAIVGVEALVRWQHPEKGLLPPAEFLRQVDGGGLMPQLTDSVLTQALCQCAAWRAAGTPVTVSVNVTATELVDPLFPERVALLLDSSGVPGDALALELTEDLFLADQARAERVMSGLISLGTRLVVDDYGTGYSSLSYLRDLPQINGLKIDRSFVTDVCTNDRSAAIVETTVALASALKLDLIAEGVETAAVRDRLAALGCTLAQGYLFSRPVPATQLQLATIPAAIAKS